MYFSSILDSDPKTPLERHRAEMRRKMFERREYYKLVQDVGDYVLEHLNLTVDTEKAIKELEELNNAIERLGE